MKRKAAWILTILLIVSLINPAYSFFFGKKKQEIGKIWGIVIAPSKINSPGARYSPVEGAGVTLKGPGKTYSTMTDKNGSFFFLHLPTADYVLSITKAGYGSYSKKIHLSEGEQVRLDNIALVPGGPPTSAQALIEPDTVYVAYAKTKQKKYGKPTSMWRRAAISSGAHPFDLSGHGRPDYTQINPYDKGQESTRYPNCLMTIDPDDSSKVDYVKVEARPTWLTFNAAGTKLYVATDDSYVQVYDILRNNILIGSVQLPYPATDINLSRDGAWIFISYGGTGGVVVASTKTHAPVNTIEVPSMSNGSQGLPMAIAASRNSLRLFVALSSMNFGEVVAIDAYTKQPIARAPVGHQPTGMAMSPDGSKLYVCNHNSASVSILSTNPLALINTVSVGVSPARICVSPDGGKVYVSNKGSGSVTILSGATGSNMGSIRVGREPMGLAISGDGSRLYVANHGDGTVSMIDTRARYVVKTTKTQPISKPFGVAIKP